MGLKVVFHQNYVKVQYAFNKDRKLFSTGVSITKREHLLSETGQLSKTIPDFKNKQTLIDNAWKKASTIRNQYFQHQFRYPSVKEFKDAWSSYDLSKIEENDMIHYLDLFIESKNSELSSQDKRSSSLQHYIALKKLIEDYQKVKSTTFYLEDITGEWVSKFIIFLRSDRRTLYPDLDLFSKKPFKNSTLRKRIEKLLSFYKWLDIKGIYNFPKELHDIRKNLKVQDTVKETLTKEEVNYLSQLSLENEKDQFILDYFVLSCNLGMRDSDLSRISKRSVIKNRYGKYYQSTTYKTDIPYKVPINSIAENILEKHNYNFNLYPNAVINKGIKKVLKNTGMFNELTDIPKGENEYKKRWEAISIHRGRDTFITLLVEAGVNINEIMMYTGHKDLSSFQRYLNRQKPPKMQTDLLVIK